MLNGHAVIFEYLIVNACGKILENYIKQNTDVTVAENQTIHYHRDAKNISVIGSKMNNFYGV